MLPRSVVELHSCVKHPPELFYFAEKPTGWLCEGGQPTADRGTQIFGRRKIGKAKGRIRAADSCLDQRWTFPSKQKVRHLRKTKGALEDPCQEH